ncbi:hypothetical protein LTR15_005065 [Elasticomyces elasticus]|nr:hypothetical protein LTR15_005065 [Elasticomyces elasticus]
MRAASLVEASANPITTPQEQQALATGEGGKRIDGIVAGFKLLRDLLCALLDLVAPNNAVAVLNLRNIRLDCQERIQDDTDYEWEGGQ